MASSKNCSEEIRYSEWLLDAAIKGAFTTTTDPTVGEQTVERFQRGASAT